MSTVLREFQSIPYYEPRKNLQEQLNKSSKRRNKSKFSFLVSKSINFLLSQLAYNCPVNSWRIRLHKWRGVNIGTGVFIGLKCTLDYAYPEYIYIEDNVSLAGNNYILAHSNPYSHFNKTLLSYVAPVTIKQGVWIGIGAIVLPDVEIGEYCIINAGAIVNKSFPEKVIIGGNPASIIKKVRLR